MSTIVVTKKNNQVCITADTLTSFGDTKLYADYDKYHNKIQYHAGSYIGIVGSAAHAVVMEDVFQNHHDLLDFSSREAIFKTFLKLHPVLKENYYLNPKDGEDDPYESTQIDAVIANDTGIYAVYSLRDVNEFTRFWAIGSGADYALGAMYATYESEADAGQIAEMGVKAGAAFNNATALPMTSQTIELK